MMLRMVLFCFQIRIKRLSCDASQMYSMHAKTVQTLILYVTDQFPMFSLTYRVHTIQSRFMNYCGTDVQSIFFAS